MAWSFHDRYLWLGLAAFFLIAGRGVSYGLRHTLRLTRIEEPSADTDAHRESHAEDSISLESLQTLATSSNHDIAHAAVSLLVSRFALSDSACNELTLSLFSSNKDTRLRAHQVLDLLDAYPLPTDFPKTDILRTECVRDLQNRPDADQKTNLMCMRFFKALGRLRHGRASYRDVADAVESAGRLSQSAMPLSMRPDGSYYADHLPLLSSDDDALRDLDLGLESLDIMLSRAASSTHPVRVPTAALSAMLRNHQGRLSTTPPRETPRFPDESPEEAEVRRRRNRAARVLEIAEDYIIV